MAGKANDDALRAVLVKSTIGRLSPTSTDQVCATDPGCLAKLGQTIGAPSVVAVIVTTSGPTTALTLMLVDVSAALVIGTRDITIPEKKLAKQLDAEIQGFIDSARVDKAKALFAEGNQHYNLGEFKQALEIYKLAYRVKPLPGFQFNIAQCYRKLGQYKDAVAMYQAYLVGVPNADNATTVEGLLKESQDLATKEEQAVAQREKDQLEMEKKKVEGARKVAEAAAMAETEKHKAEQARIARERELYDRHPVRSFTYLGAAVGLVALGGGVYFATQGKNLQTKFDALACGDRSRLLPADQIAVCRDYEDRGKRDALIGNVGLISGGAVLATAVLVYLIDPGNVERPEQPRVGVTIAPTSITAVVRW
ncbi:MAG TPA: hypothetical protein VLB44_00045 [Kofleriaceae bacterium]|nr:hypothetical protein [Kofleriaceae bacterium]